MTDLGLDLQVFTVPFTVPLAVQKVELYWDEFSPFGQLAYLAAWANLLWRVYYKFAKLQNIRLYVKYRQQGLDKKKLKQARKFWGLTKAEIEDAEVLSKSHLLRGWEATLLEDVSS
eukprot:EG_transcript_35605